MMSRRVVRVVVGNKRCGICNARPGKPHSEACEPIVTDSDFIVKAEAVTANAMASESHRVIKLLQEDRMLRFLNAGW
ncbi:MAG: hypothetical protein Q7R94_02615 [bacterium]|nr:hypothetical protein [bacterium]